MHHSLYCIGVQLIACSVAMLVAELRHFHSWLFPSYRGVIFFVLLGILVAVLDWRNVRRQVLVQPQTF
jgi:hypothetical protein